MRELIWVVDIVPLIVHTEALPPLVVHILHRLFCIALHCITPWFAFSVGSHGLILGRRHLVHSRSLVWMVSRMSYFKVSCLSYRHSVWSFERIIKDSRNALFKAGFVHLLLAMNYEDVQTGCIVRCWNWLIEYFRKCLSHKVCCRAVVAPYATKGDKGQ